jgi:hypothetical protein
MTSSCMGLTCGEKQIYGFKYEDPCLRLLPVESIRGFGSAFGWVDELPVDAGSLPDRVPAIGMEDFEDRGDRADEE